MIHDALLFYFSLFLLFIVLFILYIMYLHFKEQELCQKNTWLNISRLMFFKVFENEHCVHFRTQKRTLFLICLCLCLMYSLIILDYFLCL